MSTICFDKFYLDQTLLNTSGVNGIIVNNNISYTQSLIPLINMNPQTLVPAGTVLTAINALQTQITNLQNQLNNIPTSQQNVNIVPGNVENQYYLRANLGNEQFNILTTTFNSNSN
jgi:hypothetical protein